MLYMIFQSGWELVLIQQIVIGLEAILKEEKNTYTWNEQPESGLCRNQNPH